MIIVKGVLYFCCIHQENNLTLLEHLCLLFFHFFVGFVLLNS